MLRKLTKTKQMKELKINKAVLGFLIPSLIGVSIFILIPFLDVVIRSFQSEVSREFVFLDNYIEIFSNIPFRLAAKNTLRFVLVCIPLLLGLSLLLAVLIHELFRSSEKLTTSFLVPLAIPIASVVLVWRIVFHQQGILNGFLVNLGASGVDWMNSDYAFWILVFTYIWKNLGYNIILWLAGLSCIPKEIYEAAKVDGASRWSAFRNITMPILKPTLYTITVLSLLNSFKVFREAYLIAGDYPDKSMYLLQHLFNNWFRELSFGKISAASVVMSVIIFILIMFLQRSWESEN
ncbi:sugar ABC transporter permease [Paraclostridium ghonii]|uniref:Multiple sugar transport system permease protein n=1 Tax=Paraclostridium ghonii TaxID=29358 RepID=A0ABU0MZJ4_9FIRM|nr:sugar ABC transporter permease [Paeniclostridium ghonii]MDQ0556337.1 multiple sugar transport system permease protein [Paeniclostridium ghonii]